MRSWIWWNTFCPLNSTYLWLFCLYQHGHRWFCILWTWNLALIINWFNITCTSFYWSWFSFCNLTILMQLINSSSNICSLWFTKMLIWIVWRVIKYVWYCLNWLSWGFCIRSLSIWLSWSWFYFRILIILLRVVLSPIWCFSTPTIINCTVWFQILIFVRLLVTLLI